MDDTFYGQEIDYTGEWLTEWYGCPNCGVSLMACMCDDSEMYIRELIDLVNAKRQE